MEKSVENVIEEVEIFFWLYIYSTFCIDVFTSKNISLRVIMLKKIGTTSEVLGDFSSCLSLE